MYIKASLTFGFSSIILFKRTFQIFVLSFTKSERFTFAKTFERSFQVSSCFKMLKASLEFTTLSSFSID